MRHDKIKTNSVTSKFGLFISIISIILSVCACISVASYSDLLLNSIDHIAMLISVLAILITVILGWQIYTAIFFDDRINNKVDNVRYDIEQYISARTKEIERSIDEDEAKSSINLLYKETQLRIDIAKHLIESLEYEKLQTILNNMFEACIDSLQAALKLCHIYISVDKGKERYKRVGIGHIRNIIYLSNQHNLDIKIDEDIKKEFIDVLGRLCNDSDTVDVICFISKLTVKNVEE